jgi:hypothetical protein
MGGITISPGTLACIVRIPDDIVDLEANVGDNVGPTKTKDSAWRAID